MARKTNAEKQAEQQAEREALEAKEAAEYSHRLMKALEVTAEKRYYNRLIRHPDPQDPDYPELEDDDE